MLPRFTTYPASFSLPQITETAPRATSQVLCTATFRIGETGCLVTCDYYLPLSGEPSLTAETNIPRFFVEVLVRDNEAQVTVVDAARGNNEPTPSPSLALRTPAPSPGHVLQPEKSPFPATKEEAGIE
ncbi:hypothetical protein PAPYR_1741 [Paratrimastix pyriformis]|uniref:Uncharacterized protein n=1 Tax=Paratrimastix pyriformis TaxID=342808 RepID=A0ABQ8UWA1_9EUKA|nr:hypothetical protein PAPYR_1741 [Paratrimastix pyriformis]